MKVHDLIEAAHRSSGSDDAHVSVVLEYEGLHFHAMARVAAAQHDFTHDRFVISTEIQSLDPILNRPDPYHRGAGYMGSEGRITIDQMIDHLEDARQKIGGDKVVFLGYVNQDSEDCEEPLTEIIVRYTPRNPEDARVILEI